MAVPHKKNLLLEPGGKKAHWYRFLKPRRRVRKARSTMSSGGVSKPGTWWVLYTGQRVHKSDPPWLPWGGTPAS